MGPLYFKYGVIIFNFERCHSALYLFCSLRIELWGCFVILLSDGNLWRDNFI
jgi:hypothetical protein